MMRSPPRGRVPVVSTSTTAQPPASNAPLARSEPLFARGEVAPLTEADPGGLRPGDRALVGLVGAPPPRAPGEEVARGGPLLALLRGAAVAAAEHRLGGLVHRLHRREEV